MLFSDWSLRDELKQALAELQFDTPTEVQQATLEPALAGRDIMVQSRTGSGKTFAFALPVLQRLQTESDDVSVLIILPTRELCMQVATQVRRLAGGLGVKVASVYGGGSFQEQLRAIKQGALIVCGTPGRLCEHIDRRTLKLANCHTLILDEADEMLTLGFADELQRIVSTLPADRQTMLFSATLSDSIRQLARTTMRNPQVLTVNETLSIPTEIHHVCFETPSPERVQALVNLLHADAPQRALVFCHTIVETTELAERLLAEGFSASVLNGDLPQAVRTRTLQLFRDGKFSLLVATDVAARGIDVEGITHVFNMAVPRSAETYVHRVGRTGRAGASGVAATFVTPRDSRRFRQMLTEAGVKVEIRRIPQPAAVQQRLKTRFLEKLGTVKPGSAVRELARDLLQLVAAEDLVLLLLEQDPAVQALLRAGTSEEKPVMNRFRDARAPRVEDHRRERRTPASHEADMVRIKINVGRRDKLNVGQLVRLVCDATGLNRDTLGLITLEDTTSTVDVKQEHVREIKRALHGHPFKGRPLRISSPHG